MKHSIEVFRAPDKPEQQYIQTMFDGMASRYHIFTKLIGFGQDDRLRGHALAPIRKGMRVLDLGCGTGDLVLASAERVGPEGCVVGLDLSAEMLQVASARAERLGSRHPAGRMRFVHSPAEALPLQEAPFDYVVSAYVLRNLYENIDAILVGVRESLKPGGGVCFLDLTEPRHPFKRALFKAYFTVLVGIYGLVLFGKKYPVHYLPDSADRFYKSDECVRALGRAGFVDIKTRPFMLGAVTLYTASAPGAV